MHSTMPFPGVLIPHISIAALDPRLDFFAGTVAGAYIMNNWRSLRPKELIPGHVCIRLVQEWPP